MTAAAKLRLRRWLLGVLRLIVFVAAIAVAVVFTYQDRLLWHPRSYAPGEVEAFPRPLLELGFQTVQGHQVAFYAPPRDGRATPSALWILFAGNGSLALDWRVLVADDFNEGNAFLFIDYPGYGRCEGHPSPTSIAQNVDGAMDVLARRLGQPDRTALERTLATSARLGAAGYSMGTGAALEFAAHCPAVSRVVLVAPFTSLRSMAERTVGWPLCWLLRGNFDNRARLDELAARATPSRVLILHGEHDSLIPPAMGRALAAAHLGFVRFEAVAGADHGDVVAIARARLVTAINER